MIGRLLGGTLLREVPDHLYAGVQAGQFQVFGSIVKSVADGQIVGHLQEAGGLSKLAGLAASGPLAPARLLLDGAKIVQDEQIKAGVAHLQAGVDALQSLGVANLALGAAGIGVSVAGFAVLSRKIDRVRREVTSLGDRIDAVGAEVQALRRDLVDADLHRLRALAEGMDEGWLLAPAAAERQWHGVAEEAAYLAIAFERRGARLLEHGITGLAEAEPMLDALSLACGLHVGARAAAGEERAAQAAADRGARAVEALTGGLGLADLARARVAAWKAEPGTNAWGHALALATEDARPIAAGLREREAAAATRGAPLRDLAARGVRSRDGMEAARDHGDDPLLLLLVE